MVSQAELEQAAALLRQGGLVVFPTETVYGLGANALDPAAIKRIYEVKGRPPTSPLIVHVSSREMARTLVQGWPPEADLLALRYWPGPLTLVLKKHHRIPEEVTAGLDTVGLRVPSHPVAQALIRMAGVPVAAPSANKFTGISPTTAEHARASLGSGVDLILDDGPTTVGIESTVVSLGDSGPVLLRPGMISQLDIEEVIGPVGIAVAREGPHRSPGMHRRHYSPRTGLIVIADGVLPLQGRGAYLWLEKAAHAEISIPMPANPGEYAAALYDVLHQLDRAELDWIAVEQPPDTPPWEGILDRLKRAACPD